nr:hypothetical protein [Tanacetum cinerariifolium]
MKSLSDAKVKTLPKPWRTFRTIINKCLSGKVTGNDLLHLSQAQILWGMYYQKNVNYVYLLWEDLVYQIENKEAKKNKDMYYPRFTKVIINHFISKDQSIPRRNKVDWHMANDDPILNTMRSSPSMKLFKNTVIPKPKYAWRSTMERTDQAPKASTSKRLKATMKVAKSGKKKLPTKGLEMYQKWHSYDEVTQGDNVKKEKLDEDKTNKEEEVNELYNDVNINLEGRYTEMTNALLANVQATQVIEDTHVIMTVVTPEVQ